MALATEQPQIAEASFPSTWTRFWNAIWKFIKTKSLGAAGGAIILIMILATIFADFITYHDPYELSYDLQFSPPSLTHPFGTDEFGRDLLTRCIYGARIALFIGFATSFLGEIGRAHV